VEYVCGLIKVPARRPWRFCGAKVQLFMGTEDKTGLKKAKRSAICFAIRPICATFAATFRMLESRNDN
jgi:hypothetical protein